MKNLDHSLDVIKTDIDKAILESMVTNKRYLD
jgi:hypothetical protein